MSIIGVDLGGTKTAAALVGEDGSLGPVRRVPTRARAGHGAVLDAVAALVEAVHADAVAAAALGGAPVPALRGVGVGAAGVVDADTGRILSSTDSFSGWTGTDVVGQLKARLGAGTTVHLQNDVDAHAVGESWVGAAAGARSALVVAVGTGVGGSLVLDGRPWRGAHSVAGEIGHIPVAEARHLRCPCGRTGHLEAIGAGPGLLRHYLSLGGAPATANSRAVVALAHAGETVALRAVRESAAVVGRTLAGLVTTVDPEVVVLTGGLVAAGPVWWDAMDRALRAELIDVLQAVPVRPASLGDAAAVLGAARPVWASLSGARP